MVPISQKLNSLLSGKSHTFLQLSPTPHQKVETVPLNLLADTIPVMQEYLIYMDVLMGHHYLSFVGA